MWRYESTANPGGLFTEAVAITKMLDVAPEVKKKIAALLVAASDKIVTKEVLREGLEELRKMGLKILEVAEEVGMEKGLEVVAINMLKRGKPIQEICGDTGLSEERVLWLQSNLLRTKV